MAVFDCTKGNKIEILQGTMPERVKKHFGLDKKDDEPFVCERCGDCCIWCFVPVHPIFAADYRVPEWLSARGAEITYEKATIDGAPIELPFLTFKLPCPNLVIMAGGKSTCCIHDRKPVICQQYRCDRDPILKELKTKKENRGHEF